MPAALGRRFTFVSLLLLGGGGTTQAQSAGAEPLRKSDLLRLLSVRTLGSGELAALVRRTCLSFAPSRATCPGCHSPRRSLGSCWAGGSAAQSGVVPRSR